MAAKKAKTKTVYRNKAKKKTHHRAKPSTAGMVKGMVYAVAIGAPGVVQYGNFKKRGDTTMNAVAHTLGSYASINSNTNKPDLEVAKQMWAPTAAVTVVDWGTSKLGIQKYPMRAINKILR